MLVAACNGNAERAARAADIAANLIAREVEPFGEGDVPWKKIFDAAESAGGIEYYLIEQEESPDQLAMAERCLANWKKLRM